MECKSLRESGEELRNYDIAYFGASCDTKEKNKEFYDKLELDYQLLSDTDRKVAKAYGILNSRGTRSNRVTIFVDKEGKIAHIQTKVNVREHGKEIVEQLEKLDWDRKSPNLN